MNFFKKGTASRVWKSKILTGRQGGAVPFCVQASLYCSCLELSEPTFQFFNFFILCINLMILLTEQFSLLCNRTFQVEM